ncbi:uncharacterized protein PHACADRAFT_261041 [Phanerochaete carnosa HHB-10118-sp]|uniref:BTB domain-containing protein n=1 Tax=Phanerochaete carnosa (strain HHB-10118-sp) TaxID=650164 RepID=K5W0Y4_PHACS|nr:uncharacterized protein PHACADRAFT_261041 [Phanerochaete carnosa HHB-10118-sp]EKM52544.1 hypothetical protein PHACADRAFT_261041 [Phanerochaete carnosa HHB-10118-sp]
MFSLVQPPKEVSAELDRIDVSEDSTTLEILMRLCYPVNQPKISDWSLLGKVLGAAMKYQMEIIADLLKVALRSFIDGKPLRCFTVACQLQLEEEAELAAKAWKTQAKSLTDTSKSFASTFAGGTYIPEMSTMSSAAYFRLLQYLRGGKLTKFTTTPKRSGPHSSLRAPQSALTISDEDCILRSIGGEAFPAHSVVLRVAYAGKLLETATTYDTENGSMREVPVDLDSSTLRAMLKFCYPMSHVASLDLSDVVRVFEGAGKYGMQEIADAAKQQIMKSVETRPLSVYLLAGLNGWVEEAQEAARRSVLRGLRDTYVPEMEEVPAPVYHALLEFQHRSRSIATDIVATHAPNAPTWLSVSANHLQTLPIAPSLPLVEEMILGSGVGGQYECHTCDTSYFSAFIASRCPTCYTGDNSRMSAVLEESAAMEREIRDALAQLPLYLQHQVTPRSD